MQRLLFSLASLILTSYFVKKPEASATVEPQVFSSDCLRAAVPVFVYLRSLNQKHPVSSSQYLKMAVLAIFVFSELVLTAQGVQRFPVRTYSTSDGISQSSVYHILKDRNGYIWAGTGDGLNRLTPHSVEVFKRDVLDSASLAANAIRGLVEDADGNIWIGTDKGLNVFENVSGRILRSYRGQPLPQEVPCVPVGIFNGELILFQYSKGFLAMDLQSGKISRRYLLDESLRSDTRCLYLHADQVWAAGLDGSILQLDLNTGQYLNLPVPWQDSVTVSQVGPIQNGFLCVSVDNRVFKHKLDQGDWQLFYDAANLVLSFGVLENDEVWISSWGEGLIRLNERGQLMESVVKNLSVFGQESIDLGTINCIVQTDDKLVWLGVEGVGLASVSPLERFKWISANDPYFPGVENAFCRSLEVLNDNEVFFGTYLGGLYHLNFERNAAESVEYPENVGRTIESVVHWSQDSLVVGTETGLWLLFERQQNRYTQAHKLADLHARHLERVDENLIIGAVSGLFHLNLQNPNDPTQLESGNFRFIIPTKTGFLALSTTEIFSFDSNIRLVQRGGTEAVAYIIKSLTYSEDSGIWAATENGLLLLDADSFNIQNRWSVKDGLADNFVYGVLEHDGYVWGSGNRGLFCLEPSIGKIRTYTKRDGLQANEFNSSCFVKLPNGRMIFGGVAGLSVFHPEDFVPKAAQDVLALKRILLNDQERDPTYFQQKLTSNERNFNFEWDVLDWKNPDRTLLKCRLEGLDSGWTDLQTRKNISYTALPPGKYKLWAKSSNADGNWTEPELFASFHIAPPFYKTWWFITLAILLSALFVGSVVYFASTLRYRRRVAALERQKEIDQLRKRISRDIHDDVGADLSKIMMLSQQMEVTTNAEDFGRLNALAKSAIDGLSEVVWTVNSDYDRLPDFVAWLRVFSFNFFDRSGVELEFKAASPLPDYVLVPDLRRNLLLIFKETLNNIIKHAKANAVTIDILCTTDGILQIKVSDNGKGFSTEGQFCGNGLRNMKQRAEDSEIEWKLISAPNQGTQITLQVLLVKKNTTK